MSAIAEASSELIALAFRIADVSCRVDIETFCERDGGMFYDTRDASAESLLLTDCLVYLDARRLIERDRGNLHRIRFLYPPQ
jgi:hypothetical protein